MIKEIPFALVEDQFQYRLSTFLFSLAKFQVLFFKMNSQLIDIYFDITVTFTYSRDYMI